MLRSPHRVVCPGGGLTDHWISEIAKFTDLRVFEAKGKYTKEGEQVSLVSFFYLRFPDLEAADIVVSFCVSMTKL
jgi:hypothetical protein